MFESKMNGLSKGLTLLDLAKKHSEKSGESLQAVKKKLERQLKMGIQVEMEHTKDYDTAETIAMDHLVEDAEYYTKLKKAKL